MPPPGLSLRERNAGSPWSGSRQTERVGELKRSRDASRSW